MRIKFFLNSVFFIFPLTVLAQKPQSIANFTAGIYVLESATGHPDATELCLDGEFSLSESGQQILLGPKHGFSLNNKVTKKVAIDDPAEKGCMYENSNIFSPSKESTLVASKEVLKCDGEERHMFTETARITKGRIHLEFKQMNYSSGKIIKEKNTSYTCIWTLTDRSAASVKKSKK